MAEIPPAFGVSTVDSLDHGRSADLLELDDGFATYYYNRSEGETISSNQELTDYWGIQDSSTNAFERVITSATLTQTEEVQTHDTAIDGAVPGTSAKLVYVDKCIYIAKTEVLSITGTGSPPSAYRENTIGTTGLAPSVTSLLGGLTLDLTDAIFSNFSTSHADTEFREFTLEFTQTTAQTDGLGTTHMVDALSNLPTFLDDILATFYSTVITETLTQRGYATRRVDVTQYPGATALGNYTFNNAA